MIGRHGYNVFVFRDTKSKRAVVYFNGGDSHDVCLRKC